MARQLRFDLGSHLFFGDNLAVLPEYIADEVVDLIYLDPPFNSKRSYNAIFRHVDGTPAAAQIKAFTDTWHWNLTSEITFKRTVEAGGPVSRLLLALRDVLGTNDVLAYLTMMAPRLQELHRVLKPTGTIYLHCDPTASHYLKLVLDAVFGPEHMLNEVIWKRTETKGDARRKFGAVHDSLLAYAKSNKYKFNPVYAIKDEDYLDRFRLDDHDGKGPYRIAPLDSPNPRPNLTYEYKGFQPPAKGWRVKRELMEKLDAQGRLAFPKTKDGRIGRKHYLSEQEGAKVADVWTDIRPVQASSAERIGYPTQKPLALLERIIAASSDAGDLVLDPFCGCGTAIAAAQTLGRRWIGIDITRVAIEVIVTRLEKKFPNVDYAVPRGIPTTMDEVDFLAGLDKYAFQQWACDCLGIDAEIRKGADKGIDGEVVRYVTPGSDKPWRAVVSVKGGAVKVTQIRDLRGTMEREKADAGIFVTYRTPTKPMKAEALSAGLMDTGIPRIQIVTAEELINGKLPTFPLPAGVAPIAPVLEPEHPEVVAAHPKLAAVATGA
ncbi:MAG TPA: DNA methyltransferase [Acidimicrobiales bacterium]|nr:DNA methyltransferase [Acidimicrobiales bacterium]